MADNQKGRRNLDTNDWGALAAKVVPDFANEAQRKAEEGRKKGGDKRAETGDKDAQTGKFKPALVNKLTKAGEEKPDKNAMVFASVSTRQITLIEKSRIAASGPKGTNRQNGLGKSTH